MPCWMRVTDFNSTFTYLTFSQLLSCFSKYVKLVPLIIFFLALVHTHTWNPLWIFPICTSLSTFTAMSLQVYPASSRAICARFSGGCTRIKSSCEVKLIGRELSGLNFKHIPPTELRSFLEVTSIYHWPTEICTPQQQHCWAQCPGPSPTGAKGWGAMYFSVQHQIQQQE